MTREEHRAVNEAAYPALKPVIDSSYPPKQFVAIVGGKIVADDADMYQLLGKVRALGLDPANSLVERAGDEDAPEYLEIL